MKQDTAIRSADIDLSYFDLNTVAEQDLAGIPDIGPERARLLVEHRPFDSMDDVARVPNFSEDEVDILRRAGAFVGEPVPPLSRT